MMPRQRRTRSNDYVRVLCHDHPKANRDGYVYEHTLVAERALGRYLPDGAEVHHFNEVKADNRGTNLVVCPSRKYHLLLHVRSDALRASGNPNYRKCPYCKTYDDTANMGFHASKVSDGYYFHTLCVSDYRKKHGINLRRNRRSQRS
jgi:hypothetical protein